MALMSSSYQVPFIWKDRYSETSPGQLTSYRSIFRDYNTNDYFKRQHRATREAAPATLLALELYIYLFTYTPLTHDDVCVTIFHIMQEVDWEMLAILDETRDLRVPNIYDAEGNVEEEDLWFRIRGLPDDRITSSFNGLMHRLDALGFSVTGVLRPQMGCQTWMVVWEGRGLPVEKQPALVHSRFDLDPTAIIDDSYGYPYSSIWVPPAPRLIGLLNNPVENTSPNLDSGDYIEVYDLTREDGDDGYRNIQIESDEELARVLELSRNEF